MAPSMIIFKVDYSWNVCGLLRIFELYTVLWGEAILIKATFEMHLRCMSSSWSSLHQSSEKRPNRPSSAFNVKVLFGLVHSRRHTLVFIYKLCEILFKESFLFFIKIAVCNFKTFVLRQLIQFRFSNMATKIWQNFPVDLLVLVDDKLTGRFCQIFEAF